VQEQEELASSLRNMRLLEWAIATRTDALGTLFLFFGSKSVAEALLRGEVG